MLFLCYSNLKIYIFICLNEIKPKGYLRNNRCPLRLQGVSLLHSLPSVTAQPFFSRGFLLRHAGLTKRKEGLLIV